MTKESKDKEKNKGFSIGEMIYLNDDEKKALCYKQIATYSYWIVWGLIIALFILFFVLYINYYKLNVVVEKLWNETFTNKLRSCP